MWIIVVRVIGLGLLGMCMAASIPFMRPDRVQSSSREGSRDEHESPTQAGS